MQRKGLAPSSRVKLRKEGFLAYHCGRPMPRGIARLANGDYARRATIRGDIET
jgi:hypothetical protein